MTELKASRTHCYHAEITIKRKLYGADFLIEILRRAVVLKFALGFDVEF